LSVLLIPFLHSSFSFKKPILVALMDADTASDAATLASLAAASIGALCVFLGRTIGALGGGLELDKRSMTSIGMASFVYPMQGGLNRSSQNKQSEAIYPMPSKFREKIVAIIAIPRD
jgi:hypothetical protein